MLPLHSLRRSPPTLPCRRSRSSTLSVWGSMGRTLKPAETLPRPTSSAVWSGERCRPWRQWRRRVPWISTNTWRLGVPVRACYLRRRAPALASARLCRAAQVCPAVMWPPHCLPPGPQQPHGQAGLARPGVCRGRCPVPHTSAQGEEGKTTAGDRGVPCWHEAV